MARYVAAHVKAAKAVDPYAGTDLPEYTPGQHCPVTLPSRGPDGGWKAGTQEEWDKVFRYNREKDECGLRRDDWRALKKLHMYAHYASGDCTIGCTNVKDTIEMFMKNGLACTPWEKGRHFWGLKNSVKKARARQVKALQGENQRRHDDWVETLIEVLGESPDPDLAHQASYRLEACKAALSEAAGRGGFEIPSNRDELRQLLGKMLGPSGVCPDCLVEKLLIILEHAKGGQHAGRVRSRDCKICNVAGRAFTDVIIALAHALAKTLTAEDHADVAKLAVAHARPGQATRDAKRRYARALRLAAAATVEEDEKALAHVSTTRGRAADDDADDTYQARRAAALEAEQARLAAERQRRVAREARQAALPPVRGGMRVIVKKTGARGVVRTHGTGWIGVELDSAPGATTGYRRGQLEIDKSPRKPAARKPAAKKKPSKKKARK
jgi:hypothetical protein